MGGVREFLVGEHAWGGEGRGSDLVHVAVCDLVHVAICDLVHVAVCDLVHVAVCDPVMLL